MSSKKYQPRQYWRKRGRNYDGPYTGDDSRTEQFDKISETVKRLNPTTALEVGCGWGNVYKQLEQRKALPERYAMCDFVATMLQGCYLETGIVPDLWDGKVLPYSDNGFDMVCSFWVLLHVPKIDAVQFISEHLRVAKKWLYVVSLAEWNDDSLAPHCIMHDHEQLFQGLDYEFEMVGNQGHWVIKL